ncbi:testis-expressed protein 12 isoform X1 [Hyperolius riggenbachi]|uniref:testis-expressed protein 12 isoform X1 n=2 Tax=Hyperolius riggenbachi TaxID=752182 RepID=UPI0035A3ACBF
MEHSALRAEKRCVAVLVTSMASSIQDAESKGSKRKKTLEILDSEMLQCTSPSSQTLSDNIHDGDFDTILKGMNKEINLLFSNYTEILSEQSTVDALHVAEFNDILEEAKSVKFQLKQKRESFRSQLTMIANTLNK